VFLQPELKMGEPGDPYEKEADRIADEVLRMPEASVQPRTTHARSMAQPVLHSSGAPLDTKTRVFMESRFGHDFSQVRVHRNTQAAKSAQAVNALAYTVGQNVVFGAGQYAPETASEKRLLAHELVHTIQQQHHRQLQRSGTEGNALPRTAEDILQFYGSDPLSLAKELYQVTLESPEGVRLVLDVFERASSPLADAANPGEVAYYFIAASSSPDLVRIAEQDMEGPILLNRLKAAMAGMVGGTEMIAKIDHAFGFSGPSGPATTALGAQTEPFTDLARGRMAKGDAPAQFDLPENVGPSVALQVAHMLNDPAPQGGGLARVEQGAVITMTPTDELSYVPGVPGRPGSYPHLDELHAGAAARGEVVAASVHTHPTGTLAGSAGDWYNFIGRTLLHGPQAHIIGARNGLVMIAPTIETSGILEQLVQQRLQQVKAGGLEELRGEGMDDRTLAIHVVAKEAEGSFGFSSDAIWHPDGPNNMETFARRYGMVVYRGTLDSRTLHRTE
jgi:hypothetical protein